MQARRTLDPYAILGVARDATPLQVARAHRRLAKRHHPDLHEGAEAVTEAAEQMRRINEAWAILSNPIRRREFDRNYPAAGTPSAAFSGSHWAASRTPIRPMQPASTRTWASWRATAADTRAAPSAPATAGAAALDLQRFGLGGIDRRRPDRAASARGGVGRPAAGVLALSPPGEQDPAQQDGGDHDRDPGEEDHWPDRSLVGESEALVVRAILATCGH